MSGAIDRSLVRTDPSGYEVWRELSVVPDFDVAVLHEGSEPDAMADVVTAIKDAGGSVVEMLVCFTPSGHYIGDERIAKMLCGRGIAPELVDAEASVCSIGFAAKEQKWYGWSHRAIYGFGIGYVAKEGDSCTTSGFIESYAKAHPELDRSVPVGFTVNTLGDARRVAIAFADSVA